MLLKACNSHKINASLKGKMLLTKFGQKTSPCAARCIWLAHPFSVISHVCAVMDGIGNSGRGAASLQLRSQPTYPKRSSPGRDKTKASATNALLASPPSLPQLGRNIGFDHSTHNCKGCLISHKAHSPLPLETGTKRYKLVTFQICATHVHALGTKTRKDTTFSRLRFSNRMQRSQAESTLSSNA